MFKDQFERLSIKTTTLVTNVWVTQWIVTFVACGGQLPSTLYLWVPIPNGKGYQSLFWWRVFHGKLCIKVKPWYIICHFFPIWQRKCGTFNRHYDLSERTDTFGLLGNSIIIAAEKWAVNMRWEWFATEILFVSLNF